MLDGDFGGTWVCPEALQSQSPGFHLEDWFFTSRSVREPPMLFMLTSLQVTKLQVLLSGLLLGVLNFSPVEVTSHDPNIKLNKTHLRNKKELFRLF
jgi:hypothetical protein